MTMTCQHFALIADAIREERIALITCETETPAEALHYLSMRMAAKLSHTNPRFNRDRFLRACGVED